MYRKWANKFKKEVELYPLELKGRGELFNNIWAEYGDYVRKKIIKES